MILDRLSVRDSSGNIINIPRTMSAIYWFYQDGTVPFKISALDDLLDPRLAGKVLFPAPSLSSNLQMVSLALYKGGDEKNMEPAWDFMEKLARSGNIGRVANAETDVTNSISSGETCISFAAGTFVADLGRSIALTPLSKLDLRSGFRSFVYHEGWCVLKGGNADAAFGFANFAIDARNNAEFNSGISGVPVNNRALVSNAIKPMIFSAEEMDRYAYIPDWEYLSTQNNIWMKRWEQQILPLL